jgi:hypothetical protein
MNIKPYLSTQDKTVTGFKMERLAEYLEEE